MVRKIAIHTHKMPENMVFIGMPGSGKSTLGRALAAACHKQFIDSDVCLEQFLGCALQEYLLREGYLALRAQEAQVLQSLTLENTLLATGGSAVYSPEAMAHVKHQAQCVYLQVPLLAVERRVHNISRRGLAAPQGTSLAQLYAERVPLYEQYADVTFDADQGGFKQTHAALLQFYGL